MGKNKTEREKWGNWRKTSFGFAVEGGASRKDKGEKTKETREDGKIRKSRRDEANARSKEKEGKNAFFTKKNKKMFAI